MQRSRHGIEPCCCAIVAHDDCDRRHRRITKSDGPPVHVLQARSGDRNSLPTQPLRCIASPRDVDDTTKHAPSDTNELRYIPCDDIQRRCLPQPAGRLTAAPLVCLTPQRHRRRGVWRGGGTTSWTKHARASSHPCSTHTTHRHSMVSVSCRNHGYGPSYCIAYEWCITSPWAPTATLVGASAGCESGSYSTRAGCDTRAGAFGPPAPRTQSSVTRKWHHKQHMRVNKRAALRVCYRLPHPTYLGPSSATRLLRRPPPNLHPSCACQGHTTLNQAPSRVARTLRASLDPAQPLQRCCNVREHAQTKRTRNNKNTDAVIGYTELKRSLRSLPVRAAIRSRLHVQSAAVVLQKRSPCPGHIHTAKQRDADVASESCVVKTRQAVVPVIDDVVCCVSAMKAHRRQVYSNEAERTPWRHRQGTTHERRALGGARAVL